MSFPNKKYPPYHHRHVHAGDTSNLENRSPGAPNANRRVYVSDPPAGGFPQDPVGSVYPAGTTLMGFKEELESRLVNRMGYAAHADLDSLADRPRYPLKRITTLVDGSAQTLDLYDGNWSSAGTPSNDLLVYLGPPGTKSTQAWRYVCFMRGGDDLPQRAADLSLVTVADVQNSVGVSLYPAAIPGPGYYPDGKTGKVVEIDAMDPRQIRLAEVDVGGPDTDLVSLDALCLLNYSLLQRLEQSDHDSLHKAFAVVDAHVPSPGAFLVANHDLAAAGWAVDDVIYLTTVAVMPKIYLDRQCPYQAQSYLLCGGFDRVSENDRDSVTGMVQALGGPRDLIPPLVSRIPSYPVGVSAWDPFAAIYRADFEPHGPRIQTGFAVNCTQDDTAGSAGLAPGYPHWVFMALAYAGDTILDLNPANNEFKPGPGAGQIELLGGNRWLNPGTGHSDLLISLDMVEVYEKSGGAIGDLVGVYYVYNLDPAGAIAQLLAPDGSLAGAGLPAGNGYVRLVRPIFQVTPGIKGPDAKIQGVAQFVGTRSASVDNAAIRLVAGDSSLMAEGIHKLDSGALLRVFSLRHTGQIRPTGIQVARQSLSVFPLFSLDGWAAEGNFPFDYRGVTALAAYDEPDDGSGTGTSKTGFAAFVHYQVASFNRATLMAADPMLNPCTFTAPDQLVLDPIGASRWANGTDGDLYVAQDVIEVTDAVTQETSLWLLAEILTDKTARVIRVDGDVSGTGMPGSGYCRILRPRMRQSGFMTDNDPGIPKVIGDNLRLKCGEPVYPGGSSSPYFPPALTFYGRNWAGLIPNGAPEVCFEVRRWLTLNLTTRAARLDASGLFFCSRVETGSLFAEGNITSNVGDITSNTGDITAHDGTVRGRDLAFSPARTMYHHVNLADAVEPVPFTFGATNGWVPRCRYPDPAISDPGFWWEITFDSSRPPFEQHLVFPVTLPHGAVIEELQLQYSSVNGVPVDGVDQNQARAQLLYRPVTTSPDGWAPHPGPSPYHTYEGLVLPLATAIVDVGCPTSANYQTFIGTSSPHTVDSQNQYYVRVRSAKDQAGGEPTNEYLYGIRIKYRLGSIRTT